MKTVVARTESIPKRSDFAHCRTVADNEALCCAKNGVSLRSVIRTVENGTPIRALFIEGARFGLGAALYFLGRHGEVVPLLERYAIHPSRNTEALPILAESLVALGRYQEAEQVTHRYLELNPESEWGRAYLEEIAR